MLVVVADDVHAHSIAEALRDLQPRWTVCPVTSLGALDAALAATVPDVLVLDLLGWHGAHDAIAAARFRLRPSTRVLIASGSALAPEIAEREGLPYLLKPYTPEDLVRAVLAACAH